MFFKRSLCYIGKYLLNMFVVMPSVPYILRFTKNQHKIVAQDSFLFVLRSPACFGQMHRPSSGVIYTSLHMTAWF